jgi:hypothetical protein
VNFESVFPLEFIFLRFVLKFEYWPPVSKQDFQALEIFLYTRKINIRHFCSYIVFHSFAKKCNVHMSCIVNIPEEYLCIISGREV